MNPNSPSNSARSQLATRDEVVNRSSTYLQLRRHFACFQQPDGEFSCGGLNHGTLLLLMRLPFRGSVFLHSNKKSRCRIQQSAECRNGRFRLTVLQSNHLCDVSHYSLTRDQVKETAIMRYHKMTPFDGCQRPTLPVTTRWQRPERDGNSTNRYTKRTNYTSPVHTHADPAFPYSHTLRRKVWVAVRSGDVNNSEQLSINSHP